MPDLIFNEVLWQGLKGVPAPPATHAAFVTAVAKKLKDDD